MDKTVKKIVDQAKKDKNVLAVSLFGSYARGEAHRDIDICIFLKPKRAGAIDVTKLRLEYIPFSEKYDVQVFQQLPIYIRVRILKDMEVLYCSDEDVLYDVCFATLREYSHFQPIYKTYLEAVANG